MLFCAPSRGTEWANLTASGRDQIPYTNAAAAGLTAAKLNATGVIAVRVTFDGDDVRWWVDGGADPTAAVGIPTVNGSTELFNKLQAANLRFIAQSVTGGTAWVHYLKQSSTL